MKLKLRIMKEIIERLESILKERGDTKNAFSIKVGINPSNFNRKMKGDIPFTSKDFAKISDAIGINRDWLEFGKGDKGSFVREDIDTKLSQNKTGISCTPFYDVDFALGFDAMYNDEPNVPSKYIAVPGYEKADFWCRTSGDSMKPFISNGDIIALKEIQDWQSFLPMNEVYAIMTTNDLRTVKVVRKGSDDMHFTLHAYNEDYEDQEINKATITKVFKVLGALKTM